MRKHLQYQMRHGDAIAVHAYPAFRCSAEEAYMKYL